MKGKVLYLNTTHYQLTSQSFKWGNSPWVTYGAIPVPPVYGTQGVFAI
jgi:hypothetical protein